ncbi:Ionotropic receptor 64a [Carabus blaptoides fortunei]
MLANEENLFASPIKWLIINNDLNRNVMEIVEEYFTGMNILVDSDVSLVNQIVEVKYSIVKLYKRQKHGELVIENYAVKRKNLQNTNLRTAIVITHNDTMNHLTDYRDKHLDSITKVNYILVNHLANIVNASLSYTIKNTWGYKKNNTWTGMIGELTEDKADIGGTPLFVTSDRIDTIDYIAMTTATKSKFVFVNRNYPS